MGTTLRILSANLWNGAADPDAFADQVVELGADVIAVQELAPEQAEALAAVMPYGFLAPARDNKGMGVATRLPGRFEIVPLPYRAGQAVHLEPGDWPGLLKPLEILNLHIAAPHVRPYGVGPIRRRQQWQALTKHFASTRRDSRLCVGDFNSTPAWPIYRRMCAQFDDVAVDVARRLRRSTAPTWGPTAEASRLLRIDHAFSQGVRAADFQVVPIQGSDHSAICMDLQLD